MTTPEQLTFDLPVRTSRGRGDFFVSGANSLAVQTLDGWRDWPQCKMVLIGPKGSGKSHLAHIWAEDLNADIVSAKGHWDLPRDGAALVVEDIDQIAQNPDAQTQLFHTHNHLLATGGALLMTATQTPADAGFTLPDLLSRLQATPVTPITPPDDTLLSVVLVKHFADRQLTPPPNLIPYLLRHMDRSFDACTQVVARLDKLALGRKRAITRALAAEVLSNLNAD